jgi:GTPase SAR1 family protein
MAEVGDAFLRVSSRRLVIVGNAGAGKTFLARQLARQLLEMNKPPVPVLLQAASWNPIAEDLDEFVLSQLRRSFTFLDVRTAGGARVAERLILHRLVIPFLDGWDEIPPDARAPATARVNAYRGPLVLISRSSATTPAVLPDAVRVEIRSRPPADVLAYLAAIMPGQAAPPADVVERLNNEPYGPLAQVIMDPPLGSLAAAMFVEAGGNSAPLLIPTNRSGVEAVLIRAAAARLDKSLHTTGTPSRTRRWLATLSRWSIAGGADDLTWWQLAGLMPWLREALAVLAVSLPVLPAVMLGWATQDWPAAIFTAMMTLLSAPWYAWWASPTPGAPRNRGLAVTLAAGGALLGAFVAAGIARGVPAIAAGAVLGCLTVLSGGWPLFAAYTRDAVDSSLRTHSLVGAGHGILVGLLTVGIWHLQPPSTPAMAEVALAVTVALAVAFTRTLPGRYAAARAWLAVRDELPWRLSEFRHAARRAGLLRRSGAVWLFRHRSVRDLVGRTTSLVLDRPIAEAREEILAELLLLPESVALLGPPDMDTADQTLRRQKVEDTILELGRLVLDIEVELVNSSGEEQFRRYQDAHRRLIDAAGVRPRAWFCRFGWGAAIVATVIAAVGLTLGNLVPRDIRLLAFLTLLACAGWAWISSLPVIRQRWRPVRPASLWTIAGVTTGFLFMSLFVPDLRAESWPRNTGVMAVLAAAPCIVLWLSTRAARDTYRDLSSDEPLRWVETSPALQRQVDAAQLARTEWLRAVARFGIMPLLRSRLREGLDRLALVLPELVTTRLGGVSRSDQLVDDRAADEVNWVLEHLDSASVGISGTRGAGKSTLLQRFCTDAFRKNDRDLLVLVHAPTTYDRREFLVHLFSETCARLIGRPTGDELAPPHRRRIAALLPAIGLTLGLSLVIGGRFGPSLAALVSSWRAGPTQPVVIGGAILAAGSVVWVAWRSRRSRRQARSASEVELAAEAQLRLLRYQSVVAQKTAGKVGLPGGLELSGEGSVQRTEYLRTYPELVAQFRELLGKAAYERRRAERRVVVGVDELDKMASPAEAEKFINDLKVIFGISGCFFVVAVSEEALAAFDRRALGIRTTFDSAFDRIVSVAPLTVEQAGELLKLRGVVLPDPFLWLAHTLAGGRPRELLRTVMTLTTESTLLGARALGDLAERLIRLDVAGILSAQLRHAEGSGAGRTEVVEWIVEAIEAEARELGGPLSSALESLIQRAPSVPGETPAADVVAVTRTYLYHAATLLRVFREEPQQHIPTLDSIPETVDLLADARSRIAVQPLVAWRAIDGFRRSTGICPPLIVG